MSLLGLPLELLDRILDLSLPFGIEGLALTCKAIYERATSQIRRHNALKQQWRRTTNYGGPRRHDTLHILFEISRDPLIAEYIEALDLWDDRQGEDMDVDEEEEVGADAEGGDEKSVYDFRKDQDAMRKIRDLVTEADFLKDAREKGDLWWAREWWEEMVKEDKRADDDREQSARITIALLGLLPNLNTLRLSPGWQAFRHLFVDDFDAIVPGLLSIVNAANANPHRPRPLGKLTALLPFMPAGYEERAGLQCVQPFMKLGSMTEMYLESCLAVDDGYSGIPFEWLFPGVTSPITHVQLSSCCMDADGISAFVSHTPALKIFKYSHETKWHGCEHDWNAGAFIEALARHCGRTITELAVTIDNIFGDIINGASSFLSFPHLEALEVDVQIFCGPPVESGQSQGMQGHVPEGDRVWAMEDIPCIGSMMPDHVRDIQINTDFPEPDELALGALLKNLKEQREERLHQLGRVVIRQYNGASASMVAQMAGATLETFDHGEDSPRARYLMPQWKREFRERISQLESGS